jgi:beta-lactamase class A
MHDITPDVNLLAKELGGCVSVAVRDIDNAFDFSYNENEKVWSASVIKVPVLVEAVRRLSEGKVTLDTEFVLPDKDLTPGSGVLRYMHGGMPLTYEDLMVLMIITSDNHATNMLIDFLTPESITATMRGFGYASTEVQRRIYDYDGMAKGLYNWITAGEIADLCKRIYCKQAAGGQWDELATEILRRQLDRERLRVLLPQEVRVANKPGEQENIMHDAGVLWTDDFCYSICITTSGWQCRSDAFMTIAKLSRLVYDEVGKCPKC